VRGWLSKIDPLFEARPLTEPSEKESAQADLLRNLTCSAYARQRNATNECAQPTSALPMVQLNGLVQVRAWHIFVKFHVKHLMCLRFSLHLASTYENVHFSA
jgi:hypothetical protein